MINLPDFFRNEPTTFGTFVKNPYRDISNVQRQMDRLFDSMWDTGSATPSTSTGEIPAFAPSCDVQESDNHYLMSFDLPGVKKEDIKIDFQDGILTVSGERQDESLQKGKNHTHKERFYGSFSRRFQLPTGVRPEQVEAHYVDGVLSLAVPKVQEAKVQQIKIGEVKSNLWEKLLGHKKEEVKPLTQSQEKRSSEKVA